MLRRGLLLGLPSFALALAGCAKESPPRALLYRLTITVDTPEGQKVGSSVAQLRVGFGDGPLGGMGAAIFFNVKGAATVVAKARTLWRSGGGLLRAAAIAALVFAPLGPAHSQDEALETRKEEPSIDWFFRERPLPSQFVRPVGEASCAVTKVMATERVLFAARRHGGNVALSVELQAQENVETLAISKSQILEAQFYRTAPRRLPDRLKDRGEPGAVDTHFLQMPVNEDIFVFLCRIDSGYYLSYSLNIY